MGMLKIRAGAQHNLLVDMTSPAHHHFAGCWTINNYSKLLFVSVLAAIIQLAMQGGAGAP